MMRNNIICFCDMGKSSYIFYINKEHLKNEESVKPLITLITKNKNKTTITNHWLVWVMDYNTTNCYALVP